MSKYIAIVKNVVEVTLVASADLAFWQEKLLSTGLFPYNRNGNAEILLSATNFRFNGKWINEFIVSLTVCSQPEGSSISGTLLVHAYNSSTFLAWIERTIFKTPYFPGYIRLDARIPGGFVVGDRYGSFIQAQMAKVLPVADSEDETWEGPIFLPGNSELTVKPMKYYIARLGGFANIYLYLSSQNMFIVRPHPAYPFSKWLIDSQVSPCEWRIRTNAVHSRSRTYRLNGNRNLQ